MVVVVCDDKKGIVEKLITLLEQRRQGADLSLFNDIQLPGDICYVEYYVLFMYLYCKIQICIINNCQTHRKHLVRCERISISKLNQGALQMFSYKKGLV